MFSALKLSEEKASGRSFETSCVVGLGSEVSSKS